MFGHQNNTDQPTAASTAPSADAALAGHTPQTIMPNTATSAPTVADSVGGYEMTDLPHVTSAGVPAATPLPSDNHHASTPPVVHHDNTDGTNNGASAGPSDLIDLKQSALQELSPLIGHLEQTPEEKFRTTMMMIQASDDQSMLQTAFQAAKDIKDEKARAQALLDVVNEINYFTQQHNDAS